MRYPPGIGKPDWCGETGGQNRRITAYVSPPGLSLPGPTFQTRPGTGGPKSTFVRLWFKTQYIAMVFRVSETKFDFFVVLLEHFTSVFGVILRHLF